ncbi:MAG: ACP S-malonyltransferase, partial [Candidatus Omnitrophota bacterium]
MLDKKYGLLFPGQGAQSIGMGKELYENSPAAKAIFDQANEILERDITELCFEGPEEELQTTANSQPAIFTTSIATLSALIEKIGGDVSSIGSVVMGLSLGEPTSLVASGAMSFEYGLKFVAKRGQFMEEASQKEEGKMASIMGMDLEKVEGLCKGIGGCQVANLNCPGQVVISGSASRVELASDLAKTQGAKRAVMLKVSGAFHSELMEPAKEKLKEVLDGMEVKEPVIDFISNIDAEVTRDPEKIKENLVNQLDHRTLWEASVRKAMSSGVKDYLEIGPGSVLKGLLRKIDTSLNVIPL